MERLTTPIFQKEKLRHKEVGYLDPYTQLGNSGPDSLTPSLHAATTVPTTTHTASDPKDPGQLMK